MKITIYELLGLIKDGKAPKKIKYLGNIYEYNKKDKRYHNVDPKRLDLSSKFGDFNFNYLDDEVEILDEEDEFIDIEELDVEYDDDGRIDGVYMARPEVEERKIINDLIKNQKKIISKIDKIERLNNE